MLLGNMISDQVPVPVRGRRGGGGGLLCSSSRRTWPSSWNRDLVVPSTACVSVFRGGALVPSWTATQGEEGRRTFCPASVGARLSVQRSGLQGTLAERSSSCSRGRRLHSSGNARSKCGDSERGLRILWSLLVKRRPSAFADCGATAIGSADGAETPSCALSIAVGLDDPFQVVPRDRDARKLGIAGTAVSRLPDTSSDDLSAVVRL